MSLPMRERELKRVTPFASPVRVGSLPMRERELKQGHALEDVQLGFGRSPCGSVN